MRERERERDKGGWWNKERKNSENEIKKEANKRNKRDNAKRDITRQGNVEERERMRERMKN